MKICHISKILKWLLQLTTLEHGIELREFFPLVH